jgi:hypothetical protein
MEHKIQETIFYLIQEYTIVLTRGQSLTNFPLRNPLKPHKMTHPHNSKTPHSQKNHINLYSTHQAHFLTH